MNKLLTILMTLLSIFSFGQNKIYYDAQWKETTKENHVYYRPMPLKKLGELVFIQDYYKNGQLQYQGYAYADSQENDRVGDVFWYNEEGFDSKISHYENLTDVKELTYYYPNGKEWKKILYNERGEKQLETTFIDNKKPLIGEYYEEDYYGTFTPTKFYNNYHSLDRNNHSNKNNIPLKNTTKYLPKEIRDYSTVIYWNTGKLAKKYSVLNYDSQVAYWDKEGNLINLISDNSPSEGTKRYTYYTKFGIAYSISSESLTPPKGSKFNNITTVFSSKGKILKIEKENYSTQEIHYFDKEGKETVQIFKERKPYDGTFKDTISNKVTYFKMIEGKRIGEVITKNYESDTIVAKGSFKDGKPYEGTFYNLNDKRKTISEYKNFKLDGVQKVFTNNYADILEEIYTMKEDLKDGYRKVYKDGVLIKEEEFKNGLPFNGSSIEGKQMKNYKNGELVSIDYYKDKSYDDELRDLQYTEYYTKDQLVRVQYKTFKIKKIPQPVYNGFYKDEKPYNGYFISPEVIIDNIYLIDYYENGVRLYQYSFDFLEQLDTFRRLEYNQRTTFKDGKVDTGYRYHSDKGLLLRLRYQDGQINLIETNGFGMHAFNRQTIELNNDEVVIKDFTSPLYLKIFKKSEYLDIELYDQNGKADIKKPAEVKDKTPNSNKIYYLENNTLKSYNRVVLSEEYYNELEGNYKSQETLHTFYSFHPFNKQTPKEFFAEYAYQVETVIDASVTLKNTDKASKEKLQLEIAEKLSTKKKDDYNQFGFLKYNEKGEPSEGTEITKVGSTYKIDFYINDRKVKTTTYKNLADLKEKDPITELINIYNN